MKSEKLDYVRLLRVILSIVGLLVVSTAAKAQSYSVVDMGSLGGGVSDLCAINSAGMVVGDSFTSSGTAAEAFIYSNGAMANLQTTVGSPGHALAINNAGTIVGWSGTRAAYVLYSNGTISNLNASDATGINNSGTIVGDFATNTGSNHGFSESDGVKTDLGTLGGSESWAAAINDSGTVAGRSYLPGDGAYHAFRYSNGMMTDITPSASLGWATAINNAGTIVGNYTISGSSYAYASSSGVLITICPGTAYAINNSGEIVGREMQIGSFGNTSYPFIFSNGVVTNLNSLVTLSGVTLISPTGINDSGQIIVFGDNGHAYLLSPIPGAQASDGVPTLPPWALVSLAAILLAVGVRFLPTPRNHKMLS